MTTPRPIAPARYAARKISDPRSRGACYWFEVESIDADGRRSFVAIADTREEARDIVRRLNAAASDQARRAAYARLTAARERAAELQAMRRGFAAATFRPFRTPGAMAGLAVARMDAARELRAARAAYDAAAAAQFDSTT